MKIRHELPGVFEFNVNEAFDGVLHKRSPGTRFISFDFVGDVLGSTGLFDPQGGGVTQAPTLGPLQQDLLDQITQQLLNQFQGGQLQGVTPFQGQRVAGISPLQQQGFNFAGGLGFDPSQGQGFLDTSQQALQQGLQPIDTQAIAQAFEPSRQQALSTFQRDIVPNITERFGATSGASGALNRAFAEAGRDLSLGLSAQQAPFVGQAILNAPGQQFAGAQLGGQLAGIPGQLAGQGLGFAGGLAGLGAQQRGIQQQQLGAEQQRFQEAQPFNNPFLAQFLGTGLGTRGFENIIEPLTPSIAAQLAALGQAAAGFAAAG
jgi:hypothetical protein